MRPSGTVTFLLTDVEGSTLLWEHNESTMGAAIERHDALIGDAVYAHRGTLIRSKGEGDSTFSVFEDPRDALLAAAELQLALHREPWPDGIEIRVRAALYSGQAELRGGDYYGTTPNRCARLRAVAHGGQTICSHTTADLVAGRIPDGIALFDLGLHRLRDLARAERVYQLGRPELPSDFPPLRSLGVRHNLPAQRTSFVGREHDLIAVQKRLEIDRLLTLTGVGGCGKTRLAIEVAGDQLENHPDGVFFADLAPVTDAHVVPSTVAGAVGFSRLSLGTGSGRPANELIDFLSGREALLVLDNCEHVVNAAADLVDEILERCPMVRVLATSREPLQLRGEQTYPVAPLGVPDDEFADSSEAVRLFCERAQAVRPDFVLTPENAPDIVEICRRLDGIPLAIELAAAQVAHLAPAQLIERLADRLHLTSGTRRAHRQQTLQAALDWSHELLTEGERVVLRRLAVFPGSFTLDAANEACSSLPVVDRLRSLVAKSLVVTEQEDGTGRRYRLLETVRMYAADQLAAAGEEELIRDSHRDHFLRWVESIPEEETYLDPHMVIAREKHNLRAALAWSEEQGRLDLVGRIASAMGPIWVGDIREGRRWLSLGAQAADELDPDQRVRVLTVAAFVAVLAIEAFDGVLATQAVEAAGERPGMWSSLAHALLSLNYGIRTFLTKDPATAAEVERLGDIALRLAPDAFCRGLAWFWLGQARVLTGDLEGAVDAFDKGSVEGVPGGDMSHVSLALLAGTLHIMGRHDRALVAAQLVIDRSLTLATGGLWAWALYCSLPYALEMGIRGQHTEAVAFVEDLLEIGTPRTPGVMASLVIVLGCLATMREDHEVAVALLEYGGAAIFREGIRTPVDLILHAHYRDKAIAASDPEVAERAREKAKVMSLDEAIAYGLRRPAAGYST